MPFKSQKQRKWMHANEPAMADRWEAEAKPKPKHNNRKKGKYSKKNFLSPMNISQFGKC